VDGQWIDWLLRGILHRRPERDYRARAHVGRNAIERNGLAFDFPTTLNRLQFAKEVVPLAFRQIELAIAVVVEQWRHQDVVADEELIIDPKASRILRLLQLKGAEHGHSRPVRQFMQ
jgi:hypothetical protein